MQYLPPWETARTARQKNRETPFIFRDGNEVIWNSIIFVTLNTPFDTPIQVLDKMHILEANQSKK